MIVYSTVINKMFYLFNQGVPLEEVLHFPLKERLEALLQLDRYYDCCMWEQTRKQPNPGIMSGINKQNY